MSTETDQGADAVLLALTEVIKGATSPEIQQAQAMLLRRLAQQGDVIPSRIPAPRNVTEVGGWFNLLGEMNENALRHDMMASALGLAGAAPGSVGGGVGSPPMSLTTVVNDRTVPDASLAVTVRSDFAPSLQTALADLRAAGGTLPMWSPPPALPSPTGGTGAPPSPLPWLGREFWVAPSAALGDPDTDPVMVGRLTTDPPGYRTLVRVNSGTPLSQTDAWTGLVWDQIGSAFVERPVASATFLPLAIALAATPFTVADLAAAPAGRGDVRWARATAVAGLVPGVSRLGDELAYVWPSAAISASAWASHLDDVWDGTAFRP